MQYIDGIPFKLKSAFDFSFMKEYGTVFKVYDDQDSGNICFGTEKDGQRYFVKFSGAPTDQFGGFVKCHEPVFLYMLAKKANAMRQKEHKRLELSVEQGTKRIAEIDRLIEKVFEQNASGVFLLNGLIKCFRSQFLWDW